MKDVNSTIADLEVVVIKTIAIGGAGNGVDIIAYSERGVKMNFVL